MNPNAKDKAIVDAFYAGMKLFEQGCECPAKCTPKRLGWLAACDMDAIKKRFLALAREKF